jgi:hypothetical protein
MSGKGKRKALAKLSGPVLYCTCCGEATGTYNPPEGRYGIPRPAADICSACRDRRDKASQPKEPKKKKPPVRTVSSGRSVRTVSGGLPTLGRGHR